MNKRERKDEFERHKTEIEDEYHKKLDALYILYPECKPFSENGATSEGSSRGKLSKLIRQVLKEHSGQFSVHDMRQLVVKLDPAFVNTITNIQLSNIMGRFVRKGELEAIAGSSPKLYKRKGSQ